MSRAVFAGVAVAGAAVAAGSAFTASNTFAAGATNYSGYGELTATGVTVTDIAYTPSTDNTYLSSVAFTVTQDLTSSQTVKMTLKKLSVGTTPVGASPYACTQGTGASSKVFTCAITGSPVQFTDFDTVGLTVTD
jgi:hypothetical protein